MEEIEKIITSKLFSVLYPKYDDLSEREKVKAECDRKVIAKYIYDIAGYYEEHRKKKGPQSEQEIVKVALNAKKVDEYFYMAHPEYDGLTPGDQFRLLVEESKFISDNIVEIDEYYKESKTQQVGGSDEHEKSDYEIISSAIRSVREERKNKILTWVNRGEKIIYPERIKKWKKTVDVSVNGIYGGNELDSVLSLMEKLESGCSMEEAKEMFEEQLYSQHAVNRARKLVFLYSKRGPEFYESTADRELSEDERNLIEKKKKENAKLAKLHPEEKLQEGMTPRDIEISTKGVRSGSLKMAVQKIKEAFTKVRGAFKSTKNR